jgi:hypothetical protein
MRAGMLGGLTLGGIALTGCGFSAGSSAQGKTVTASPTLQMAAQNMTQPHSSLVDLAGHGWPAAVIPAGLGVNLHFTTTAQALGQISQLASLGLRFARLDFTWSLVEHQRGHYDFSLYDPVIQALTSRGIRPLCILGYSNALYEPLPSASAIAVGPHTDAVRQAFARFASAAAAHFKGRNIVWEVWNEPDNVRFWSPTPTPAGYLALLKATVPALRRADPYALIIAPALTGMSNQFPAAWTYLENCFSLGLAGLVDAISVHPYRNNAPETVAADYQRVRSLIARYAPKSKANLPLVNSEWGYSNTMVSRDQQAAYLVRLSLVNLLNGLPISILYDWQDDGNDAKQPEDNFGLLTRNGQPKPAYTAMRTLVRELGGFRFSRRLSSGADYALLFTNGAAQKQVIWTTGDAHPVVLSIKASSVTVTNMTGQQRTQPVIRNQTVLEINGDPQYIEPL